MNLQIGQGSAGVTYVCSPWHLQKLEYPRLLLHSHIWCFTSNSWGLLASLSYSMEIGLQQVFQARKAHGTDSLSQPSEGTNPASTLILDFKPLELWDNKFLSPKRKKVIQEGKSQRGSSYQATTCIMFTNALLPKASYMPKSRINVVEDYRRV